MDLKELKKIIPYKWKVQTCNDYGFTAVAYIDARDLMDLLDDVVGPENWQTNYSEHKGNLYCKLGIRINDSWVWKEDCGTESFSDKEKGEASDALKRAGVQWGIGRFLYSLPIVKMGKEYVSKGNNGKNQPYSPKTGRFLSKDQITELCNAKIKA